MSFELADSPVSIDAVSKKLIGHYVCADPQKQGSMASISHLPVFSKGVLNNLGTLMFYGSPEIIIEGAYLQVITYLDNIGTVYKTDTVKGSLLEQYKVVKEKLLPLTSPIHEGVTGYSSNLMKSVASALVHKDYEGTDRPIEINIFPTKVVILYQTVVNPFCSDPNPETRRMFEDLGIECLPESGDGTIVIDADTSFVEHNSVVCANHLWGVNKKREAVNLLKDILSDNKGLTGVVTRILEFSYLLDDQSALVRVLNDYTNSSASPRSIQPYIVSTRYFINAGKIQAAKKALENIPEPSNLNELLLVSRLKRKVRSLWSAHKLLTGFESQYAGDPRFIQEFALVKRLYGVDIKDNDILAEAALLLATITDNENSSIRGWALFDLSKVYAVIAPDRVQETVELAQKACPYEKMFRKGNAPHK